MPAAAGSGLGGAGGQSRRRARSWPCRAGAQRGFTLSAGVGALRGLPRAPQLPVARERETPVSFLQCFIAISQNRFQLLGCEFTVGLNVAPRRPAARTTRAAAQATCKTCHAHEPRDFGSRACGSKAPAACTQTRQCATCVSKSSTARC